jgi:secreted PhoX family phosphatase
MPSSKEEEVSNFSGNETFEQVVEARLSRRGFLSGSLATAAVASLSGVGTLLTAVPASAKRLSEGGPLLGFQGIATSTADAVVVPDGYTARVLVAWGDPVSDGPAFKQDASNTAAEQAQQWGMHNDGLVYFPINGSTHGLLVENNEYTDDALLFPDGTANWTAEKTAKSQNAHGVSVIEIARPKLKGNERKGVKGDDGARGFAFGLDKNEKHGDWEVVRPSKYGRRITARTPMTISGPAAGHAKLQTSQDPTGTKVNGTINNCAMGFTPWGTYLTCEENFNGYFRKNGAQTALERRYGINAAGAGYLWHTTDSRFSADTEPNEANRFGWVVEIDPFDPTSTPVKRTALGRFKHEGAWYQEAKDGRFVVYMGDDEVNEYIYRWVSKYSWRWARDNGYDPLDHGTLYVAKFYANGGGEWLELSPENPVLANWSLADIMINTRAAADAVGATMMDRPEWIDTFADRLTAVATLTNNSRRGTTPPSSNNPDGSTASGSARPAIDAPNPRAANVYGQIITWSYRNDWTESTFRWDIFALCGDPMVAGNGSTIVGDKYGSPDGIYVAPSGRLWIQTDVSGSTINSGAYAGFGNNQMLCADPDTRETRRFLVGPKVCEITGVFVTPDERTMFVGIQHPGEAPSGSNSPANPKQFSSWPDGDAGGRPRSSCIVITKDDGGPIGS